MSTKRSTPSSSSSTPSVGEPSPNKPKRARVSSSLHANGLTTTIPEGNLLFAVPKKGRLYERVLSLLNGIGINFRRKARLDIANSTNMPISLIFLNAHDVAVYVAKGTVDLGITGEDIIAESQSQSNVEFQLKLDIGQCKLCLQAPKNLCRLDPKEFSGKRIVTSFPFLTKQYFDKLDKETGRTTSIQYVSGSVEAACGLGLADAVVDLVETGTTMRAAGLDIVEDLMSTETVLVSNPNSEHKVLIEQLSNRVTGWMMATSYNMVTYNIKREKIEEASLITPGIQAPTIIDLADKNWVAMQAMVKRKEVPQKMEELCELGATGIIATTISNCRMDNGNERKELPQKMEE
jgi:ATP phosphoribosyltransferase